MRKRPVLLFLSALILLYFPTEFFWSWYRTHRFLPSDIFFSILLPCLLLIGLIRVTKIGWYTLIAFGALWGFKDIYQIYAEQSQGQLPAILHIFVYGLSFAYFINPRVRHLYFDPKLRWWRTKPRYETHLPCIVIKDSNDHYPVLMNISAGGCFLETPHVFEVNESVDMALPLPVPLNVSVIKARGEVRWVSTNPLRQGMGVEFTDVKPLHRKAICAYVRKKL